MTSPSLAQTQARLTAHALTSSGGEVSTVEYTLGYARCDDSKVRIFLHHSSVPYGTGGSPAPKADVAPSQAEVDGATDALLRAIQYERTVSQLVTALSNIDRLKGEISGLVK